MTITASSTITEVYNNNLHTLSEDQANLLTNVTLTSGHIIGVGLAGFDLTGLYTDCAIATTNCDAADYNDYDGYAFVAQVYDNEDDAASKLGLCINDKSCFTVDRSGAAYVFNTLVTSQSPSASIPSSMTDDVVAESKCAVNTGGFDAECFGFGAHYVAFRSAFVWRFEAIANPTRF